MYSVVLMMAMSTAPDMPDARRNNCCGGCTGCSGYSCSGCSGYSCSGCDGGCHGGRSRKSKGCHGGSSCHGCSGYSCCGCTGYSSGCYGSGYGSGCYGSGYGSGCWGGGYATGGISYGMPATTGAPMMGGYGVPATTGTPAGTTTPGTTGTPGTGTAPGTTPGGTKPPTEAMLPTQATIVVSLPADATLKVDGMATRSTSGLRTFATPTLSPGQSYHYTLTAEVVRDGQTLTANQQITVRAGQITNVDLPTTAFAGTVALK